jgi:hypothetical protein
MYTKQREAIARAGGVTAVHVSAVNRAMLDELANRMMTRHPGLFEHRPNYNAIIGYAVAIALKSPEADR